MNEPRFGAKRDKYATCATGSVAHLWVGLRLEGAPVSWPSSPLEEELVVAAENRVVAGLSAQASLVTLSSHACEMGFWAVHPGAEYQRRVFVACSHGPCNKMEEAIN